jgi:hypothetical protein
MPIPLQMVTPKRLQTGDDSTVASLYKEGASQRDALVAQRTELVPSEHGGRGSNPLGRTSDMLTRWRPHPGYRA